MKKLLICFISILVIFCITSCDFEPTANEEFSSDKMSVDSSVELSSTSNYIEDTISNTVSKENNLTGFTLKYENDKVVFIDYDLNFKTIFPNDERFAYKFQYEKPDLIEGAPIGRNTLLIYFQEDGQQSEKNIIEIRSTLVGTREKENFKETESVVIAGTDKTYLVNKDENRIRILSEQITDMHCIKADLSISAFEEIKDELENIILSTEFY